MLTNARLGTLRLGALRLAAQNMVLRPVALISHGSLLDIQNLRSNPRTTQSEFGFNKAS